MEKMKVSQVAKMLGVALNSVYRKIKLCETKLNPHILKENGTIYVSLEGVEILRGLFQKLNSGETTTNKENLLEIIATQQKTIDNLISQHAQERERTAEERQRADTIIMKLTQDIGNLKKALEYKKPENNFAPQGKESLNSLDSQNFRADPRKDENKNPGMKPQKVVIEEMTFWEKIWISLFAPEKMRRFEP